MSDDMTESLRVLGNWFAKQELVKPGAICLTAADRLDAAIAHVDALEAQLTEARNALHKITEIYTGPCDWQDADGDRTPQCTRIARAALAQVKP